MKRINFSEQDYKTIVDMYKSGMSVAKIGDKYGCTRRPITRVLHECGIQLDNVLRKIPKEEYEKIVELYCCGKSMSDISKLYACNEYNVYDILKKFNVNIRKNKFTYDDAMEMYRMYKDGNSLTQIAELYDTDRHVIGKVLKRNGFATDRKTYHCNEYYFDNIDDADKAYILGLLWADGHNSEKVGKIVLQLQESDKHILEDISNVVQSDMPLWKLNLHERNPNWSDTYTLTLRSKHMSEVLSSYGMVQRKSLVATFPTCITEDLYPAFIRGYIDGDGSVCFSKERNTFSVSMVGTKMLLCAIQDICTNNGIKTSIYYKKDHSDVICTLATTSKSGALDFLNWIYSDANLKLQRKYQKYQQILQYVNTNNTLQINDLQRNNTDEKQVG